MKRILSFCSQHLQTLLIIIALVGLALWSGKLSWNLDLTASGRNTLLPQSLQTVALFESPVTVEVFIAPQSPQRAAIDELLSKYQQANTNFSHTFTDPALDPTRSRELDIAPGGELILRYANRTQRTTEVSQSAFTLALQRLLRSSERHTLFITGHGERSISGDTGGDIKLFTEFLHQTGYSTGELNLASGQLPAAGEATLVIVSPLHRFLPSEAISLLNYVSSGGDLLWFTEPESDDGLRALEHELGIQRQPGVIIDMAAQNLQIERPDFAMIHQYAKAEATAGFNNTTLFPQPAALAIPELREWQVQQLAHTGEQAWTETGPITGEVKFGDNANEQSGPLNIALSLSRDKNNRQQRVVVVGDGDFIANAWLDNGGNRDFAARLFNWTGADKSLLQLEYPVATDGKIHIPASNIIMLTILCLILLPGSLLSMAGKVWLRRRYG